MSSEESQKNQEKPTPRKTRKSSGRRKTYGRTGICVSVVDPDGKRESSNLWLKATTLDKAVAELKDMAEAKPDEWSGMKCCIANILGTITIAAKTVTKIEIIGE